MPKLSGPRSGSAAHKAICHIVSLGGTATFSQIREILSVEHQRVQTFRLYVIIPLTDFGLVSISDDVFRATGSGKEYAGKYCGSAIPVAKKYVGQIVPPRTARPHTPLNLARHRAAAPIRPGADDFKSIPSLMAGQRVYLKDSDN